MVGWLEFTDKRVTYMVVDTNHFPSTGMTMESFNNIQGSELLKKIRKW